MLSGIWLSLHAGDEVAVQPESNSPPSDVWNIQSVSEVSLTHVRLMDGCIFAVLGGAAIDGNGYIVPATDRHRAALTRKNSTNAAKRTPPSPARH